MAECNCDDSRTFQRLLQRNGFQISGDKMVDKQIAEQIVWRLQNRKIDRYKYKQNDRDGETGGPIRRQHQSDIPEFLSRCYRHFQSPNTERDCIIGIVTRGGFLAGQDTEEFILPLSPGINVLIGDRGSGKSTALNMCGCLSRSTTQAASALVTALLAAFKLGNVDPAALGRELRDRVRHYSVETYVCYYRVAKKTRAVFVDLPRERFATATFNGTDWNFQNTDPFSSPLPIQVIAQGEVHRISEPDNEFYISNILDAIYPALHDARKKVAADYRHLVEQRTYTQIANASRLAEIGPWEFFEIRLSEIDQLRHESARDAFHTAIQLVRQYVHNYRRAREEVADTQLIQLLNQGEHGLWIILIEPVAEALLRFIRNLETIHSSNSTNEELERVRHELLRYYESQDDDVPPFQSARDGADCEESDPSRAVSKESLRTCGLHELGSAQLAQLMVFLENRIEATRFIYLTYNSRRPSWSETLRSLLKSYGKLLKERADLQAKQQATCLEAMERVNRRSERIQITTVITDTEEDTIDDDSVEALEASYVYIQAAEISDPTRKLREAVRSYASVEALLRQIDVIAQQVIDSYPRFIFFPIQIDLQQGNRWRPFDQLSFGQKSGIILRLLVTGTPARILIVDQPEDNLDAAAITQMVLPTFLEFAEDRQVILATHSSQLVLGLKDAHIVVMESMGETGRTQLSGQADNAAITEALLNVLEGGIDTFNVKLKTFEEFVIRLRDRVRDMDITMIESSFRCRTIDGLRNFLQPAISDREVLRILRHELRQRQPMAINLNIRPTQTLHERYAMRIMHIALSQPRSRHCLSNSLNISRICKEPLTTFG